MKIKISCFKVLLWMKKTSSLHQMVYKFERRPTPLMGIRTFTTSDRIKQWNFCKFHLSGGACNIFYSSLYIYVKNSIIFEQKACI